MYGKVIDYNGVYGHVLTDKGQIYLILDKYVLSDNIKKDDFIEFLGEQYVTVENEINIARFVKLFDKNINDDQLKSNYIK